jgi:hypothetical protein
MFNNFSVGAFPKYIKQAAQVENVLSFFKTPAGGHMLIYDYCFMLIVGCMKDK